MANPTPPNQQTPGGQIQKKHAKKKTPGAPLDLETVDVDSTKQDEILDEIDALLEETSEYERTQGCGCGW